MSESRSSLVQFVRELRKLSFVSVKVNQNMEQNPFVSINIAITQDEGVLLTVSKSCR